MKIFILMLQINYIENMNKTLLLALQIIYRSFPFPQHEVMPKKLFVGRLPDGTTENDLYEYFSKFGEVIDVYIPKPMRGISFVTFSSGEVAKKVHSQSHRFGTNLLNVSVAEPKAAKNVPVTSHQDMHPMHSSGGWGGGRLL